MRLITLLALFGALLVSASTATASPLAPPRPNVVCDYCSDGGGNYAGYWCASPGAYAYDDGNHRLIRCGTNHYWYYA